MKKILLPCLILILGIFSIGSQAKSGNLKDLVVNATKVTGVTYTLPDKFDGDLNSSSKIEITQKNVDKVLSLALNQNGYTRVKVDENLYKIMSTRDIRYEATQMYKGSKSKEIEVPMTYDYFMLEYTFENMGLTTEVTRSLRPFMSRFGRIIDIKRSNKIILQDTGVNIHRLINIIHSVDRPRTEDEKDRDEEELAFKRELELKKAENGISDCCCEHKKH